MLSLVEAPAKLSGYRKLLWTFPFPHWETPERSLLLVVTIVAVTIVAAITMLPNTEEKAQVLLSQGRVAEAIALYETRRDTVRLNPFEAYSLANLYAAGVQTDDLIVLLEDEIALRPDSDWARTMLVSLYRAHRDVADEARVLFQIFARAATPAAFRRLIALYRLEGDRAGERATLQWALTHDLASQADLERLDYLNSLTSNAAPAAEWRSATSGHLQLEPSL